MNALLVTTAAIVIRTSYQIFKEMDADEVTIEYLGFKVTIKRNSIRN